MHYASCPTRSCVRLYPMIVNDKPYCRYSAIVEVFRRKKTHRHPHRHRHRHRCRQMHFGRLDLLKHNLHVMMTIREVRSVEKLMICCSNQKDCALGMCEVIATMLEAVMLISTLTTALTILLIVVIVTTMVSY